MRLRSAFLVPMVVLAVLAGGAASNASALRTPATPTADPGLQPHLTLPSVSDTVYHPIKPCRILDSRSGAAGQGRFNPRVQRSVIVGGTVGFAPQGGNAGGCGIPLTATGITASVTTTGAAANGYLTGWAAGTARPLANFATYIKGVPMTVGANFTLSGNRAAGLDLFNFGGPTDVIIDVTGFYTQSDSVLIEILGAKYYGGQTVLSSSNRAAGEYSVDFNHSLVGCSVVATAWTTGGDEVVSVDYLGGGSVGGGVNVHVRNTAGVPINGPFMLQATC